MVVSGARCRLFAYGPADAAAIAKPHISCLILIQTGFTFLVPAYPGFPGKEAVKWVYSSSSSSYLIGSLFLFAVVRSRRASLLSRRRRNHFRRPRTARSASASATATVTSRRHVVWLWTGARTGSASSAGGNTWPSSSNDELCSSSARYAIHTEKLCGQSPL